MVKKFGNHGLHSGNTLRYTEYCDIRNAREIIFTCDCFQPILEGWHTAERGQVPDEAKKKYPVLEDKVFYSLNKRKRWTLPDIIKEKILCDDHTHENFKISLVERLRVCPVNEDMCLSYYTSRYNGEIKYFVPTRTKTFNYHTFIVNERGTRRRDRELERQRFRPELPEMKSEDPPHYENLPEVRYEIYYPCPKTSSLSHNTRYANYRKPDRSKWWARWEIPDWDGKKYPKRKRCMVRLLQDPDSYFHPSDIVLEELEDSATESQQNEQCVPREITLYDFVTSAFDVKSRNVFRKSGRMKVSKEKHGKNKGKDASAFIKSNKIFVDKNEDRADVRDNQKSFVGREQPLEVSTVRVVLPTDDITPSVLYNTFGIRYIESQCSPRRFVIDLSENFLEMVNSNRCYKQKPGQWDITMPTLVFEYERSDKEGEDIYRVGLNLNVRLKRVRIETLSDSTFYNLDDVILQTCQYMSLLPPDCFIERKLNAVVPNSVSVPRFEILTSLMQWPVLGKRLPYSDLRDLFLQGCKREQERKQSDDINCTDRWEWSVMDFCNICYGEIDNSSLDGHPATALTCGHWFCDTCWRQHLRNRIEQGSLCLTCPEYKCDGKVDLGTLISLLSMHEVITLMTRQEEAKLLSSALAKWCPNPLCDRLVKVSTLETTEPLMAQCWCGMVFCFHCHDEAHWPASCEHMKKHRLELRRKGDEMTLFGNWAASRNVLSKRCPKCSHVIEKMGGCPNIYCLCGFGFCWTCLRPTNNHPYDTDCYTRAETEGTKSFEDLYFNSVFRHSRSRSSFYISALKHRLQRKPTRIMSIKKKLKNLAVLIQYQMTKREKTDPETGTFAVTQAQARNMDGTEFALHMFNVTLEIHHVLEHLAVLLDKQVHEERMHVAPAIFQKLEFILTGIEKIFEEVPHLNSKNTLAKLEMYDDFARQTMKKLVQLVSSFEKKTNPRVNVN